MNDRIVCVVVTFNRKNYLIECLNGLLSQSIEVEKIIIVDNASTDGTEGLLAENFFLNNSKISYYKLPVNLGGAGGFKYGIEIALEHKSDWVWLMDDDVRPESNCLEELLKYKFISECLHPRKIFENGDFYKWEHNIDIQSNNKMQLQDISFKNGKSITFVNVGCFEGMLIKTTIINMIGLPDEKYFIGEDDTLYGVKASSYTNVSYVQSAVMRKLIPIGNLSPWKSYYQIRNKFFLRKDILNYYGFSSSRANFLYFLTNRIVEMIRLFVADRRYIIPSIRGFWHGIYYTFSNYKNL